MSTSEKSSPIHAHLLTEEEYQTVLAEQISENIFEIKGDAEKTTQVIRSFVNSFQQNKNHLPLEQWLVAEFKKYPAIWKNEDEVNIEAQEIINTITRANQTKSSLHHHLDKGNTQSSWLANQIESGAAANGVNSIGKYANDIEIALEQANEQSLKIITRQDGLISQSLNLDGFIAEQHHATTFNIDAVAKGSAYRAKVLTPERGEVFGKNSMDIGIYDVNGKLVARYQSKYGANGAATSDLFHDKDGYKYKGQQKLVPKGQSKGIQNSTEVIEIDGLSSRSLSKEEAKKLQRQAQEKNEAKQYEWKDTNRVDIAKQIGKQALMGAYINAGLHGARILGRRLWNSATGQTNVSVNEDLQKFFESTITSTAHTGVQVAVSGGLVVAVKNGWLGPALKGTPVGIIANIAYVGLENAKVLYKLSQGELTKDEALNVMGQTTTVAVTTLAGAAKGAALGARICTVFGPVGTFVGGVLGGIAGGMAGGTIGQAIYDGGKAIVTPALNAVKSVVSSLVDGFRSFSNRVASLLSF